MNDQVKELWCSALRSGEYPQSCYQLRDDIGFCCLGVLCELAVKAEVIPPANSDNYYAGEYCFLPLQVAEWAGLETTVPGTDQSENIIRHLASLNDNGMSFEKIADLIEAQL